MANIYKYLANWDYNFIEKNHNEKCKTLINKDVFDFINI